MGKLGASLAFLAALASVAAAAAVPRQSPEFLIAQPGGATIALSSLKGQVVVMEFMFLRSEHCLRVARMLNELHREPGLKGFQPIAVVFDPPHVRDGGGQLSPLAGSLTFPLAYMSKDSVDNYLGRARNEILNIPQVVVIDRAGIIRAVSGGRGGDPALEDESSLRKLIDALLREKPSGHSGQN